MLNQTQVKINLNIALFYSCTAFMVVRLNYPVCHIDLTGGLTGFDAGLTQGYIGGQLPATSLSMILSESAER